MDYKIFIYYIVAGYQVPEDCADSLKTHTLKGVWVTHGRIFRSSFPLRSRASQIYLSHPQVRINIQVHPPWIRI